MGTKSTKGTNSTRGPRSKSLIGPAQARRGQQTAQEATVASVASVASVTSVASVASVTSVTSDALVPSTGLRDLALAKALAQGVRAVPGIVEVATGDVSRASGASGVLTMTTATYGPGEQVRGVGITHPTPETLAITIQVVIAASFLHPSWPVLASEHVTSPMSPTKATPTEGTHAPTLQQLAAQVRVVLTPIVQRLGFAAPATIDVVIADLR